jgi:hypothetical protein
MPWHTSTHCTCQIPGAPLTVATAAVAPQASLQRSPLSVLSLVHSITQRTDCIYRRPVCVGAEGSVRVGLWPGKWVPAHAVCKRAHAPAPSSEPHPRHGCQVPQHTSVAPTQPGVPKNHLQSHPRSPRLGGPQHAAGARAPARQRALLALPGGHRGRAQRDLARRVDGRGVARVQVVQAAGVSEGRRV